MSHFASAFLAGLNVLLAALVLCRDKLHFLHPRPRLVLAGIALLAAVGLGAHLDFLGFHGERGAVHYWDFFHYYMGSKYFAELGYGGLYDASARADAEDDPGGVLDLRFCTSSALVGLALVAALAAEIAAPIRGGRNGGP